MKSDWSGVHQVVKGEVEKHFLWVLEKWKLRPVEVNDHGVRGGDVVFANDGVRIRFEFDGMYFFSSVAASETPEERLDLVYVTAFLGNFPTTFENGSAELAKRLDQVMSAILECIPGLKTGQRKALEEWINATAAREMAECVSREKSEREQKMKNEPWWKFWKG